MTAITPTTIATVPVASVSTKEPGQAFRMMIGGVAALLVGLLFGLGFGMSRLGDLRADDAQALTDRQAAISQREDAVASRETEVGLRESAVGAREADVAAREAALR